jgi:hypothetical protein
MVPREALVETAPLLSVKLICLQKSVVLEKIGGKIPQWARNPEILAISRISENCISTPN